MCGVTDKDGSKKICPMHTVKTMYDEAEQKGAIQTWQKEEDLTAVKEIHTVARQAPLITMHYGLV